MTLRDAVDRLFQQSVVRPGNLLAGLRQDAMPIDVVETEKTVRVRASIPGVKPEDLQVTIQGNMLTISGESKAEEEREGEQWHVREHRFGEFRRSVELPAAVDADATEARCEHGVLTLTLPKVQAAQPRRISIGKGAATAPSATPSVTSEHGTPAQPTPATSATTGSADQTAGGDRVTAESQESFPASDPPSWTPEKA
jgi:HSP20 family protein